MGRFDDLISDLKPMPKAGRFADLTADLAPTTLRKSQPSMAMTAFKEAYSRTPFGYLTGKMKQAEQLSRKGLNQLADFMPDPQTTSPTANFMFGIPKVGAQVLAEFAPPFIAPEAVALNLISPVAKGVIALRQNPRVAALIKESAKRTPEALKRAGTAVKRAFTYRFGQPEAYKELAEQTGARASNMRETARDIGKALSEGLPKEKRLRLDQIIRGSVSESERELPLRLRANYARETIDDLERQAKDLDLIPETALSKYTKRQLADLRKKKAVLDARIASIKSFGSKSREKLTADAENLRIGGAVGLVRGIESVEKNANQLGRLIDTAKETLTAREFKGLEDIMSHETLRRNKAMQRILSRFEKASVGKQEEMFNQLTQSVDRLGLKVEKIYDKSLSITNFRWLLNKINSLPDRFPGKARLLRELQRKSNAFQEKIVDYYTQAGQKYRPRLYLGKEALEDTPSAFGFSPTSIMGERFLKRGSFSETQRAAMREIKEPAYPVAKGVAQVAADVERASMFRTVAQNPEWSTADAELGIVKGFTRLPTSERLGDLSEKYVHPEIARDIAEITRARTAPEKVYDKFISAWKFGKVVANPATHFRNMLSNSILLDLGGVSHLEQPGLLRKAAQELTNKGALYQEAKKSGLLGHEFVGSELKGMRDILSSETFTPNFLQRSALLAQKFANKLGDTYQSEEQLFKLAKFIKNRRTGMAVKEAAADAENWLFNYEKVSPIVKWLRKSPVGAPFITFTSKALPRVVEAAVKNPLALYKYKVLFDSIEEVSKKRLGLSDRDVDAIKRNVRGKSVILPMRDKTGAPYVMDVSYILPWGDIGESGGVFGPTVLPPSGPLKSVLEVSPGFNKSAFTGKPIYNAETDTQREKVSKASDHLLKTLLPSFTPGINTRKSAFKGGYSFQRIADSLLKRPDYHGRVRPLPAVIADTIFGLKATPVSPSEKRMQESQRVKRILADLKMETKRVLKHPGISKKEKDEALADSILKAKRVMEIISAR